jgi:hypothetical protein
VPAQVTPSRRGVTNSCPTPPLVEEEAPFRKIQKSWKKQKYGHGSQWDLKQRITVLARTGNLTDRSIVAVGGPLRFSRRELLLL